jgi:mannose-1-phosphate guanylyltransferase/mannose-6-phosphate isomerase
MNFIILLGGQGTRLYPLSRQKYPKQFLSLVSDKNESTTDINNIQEKTMLQNTVLRILKVIDKLENNNNCKLYFICNIDHSFIVEKQISELNINVDFTIVTEPKGRDSAPAICISSLLNTESEYTMILPCDHIFDGNEFVKCSIEALPYLENNIVTFGIKPTKPETGYGYIEIGENNKTEKFVEKPNLVIAEEYFNSGKYYWNAGVFIFKNKNMLNCFDKYAKDILENCKETLNNSKTINNILHLNANPFSDCHAISVDYAIMEHIVKDKNSDLISGITIKYHSHWNDIGSYSALLNELNKDENNNFIKGDILTINSKNSYIETDDSFTAVIGLDNVIVVNTRDSLLVCNNTLTHTQDVKKVVEHLKKNNREEAYCHKKVYRPWGYYVNVEGHDYNGFKVKRILVNPGKKLSLQSHNKRSEHWVITRGCAKVQVGNEFLYLNKDQYVYIPVETKHRIENIGTEDLEFTETQIGTYLGEDDIIRYEDDFGRV